MMRQLVEMRFGPTPPELRTALRDLTEEGEMELVCQRLLTAQSLAEILGGE
jgi:hypothetical protein